MNWTEGNLARHSRRKSAKDDVLRRQKQYFARARTRLLNGAVNPSPAVLHFSETGRHDRFSGQGNPFGSGNRPHAGKRRRDDDLVYHIQGEATGTPSRDDGVLLHSSKKKPAQAPTEELQGEGDSQRKRQKLLGMTDWAGLGMQQPLELTFPGIRQPGQRWGNGPRRPPQARADHAHATDQQYPGLTPGRKHQESSSHRIRVQIGSQQMSHGTGSVSRRSKERGYSLLSESTRSRDDYVRRLRQLSSSSAEGCHVLSELDAGSVHSVPSVSSDLLSSDEPRKPSKRCSPKRRVRSYPNIQEPIPLRAGHFPVLQWSPSRPQGSQSMIVETGRRSAKPPSQLADDEKWLKLTEPSNEDLIALTRGSSLLESPSFCLTSNMHPCEERHCSSSIVSHGPQRLTAWPNIDDLLDLHDRNGLVKSSESKGSASTSHGPHRVVLFPNVTVAPPHHTVATDSPYKGPKSQTLAREKEEDEDQVWKNFISENEGDECQRRAFIEAARSAARCLGPSDSSTSGSSRLCSELLQMMTEKMESRVSAIDSDPKSLGHSEDSNSFNCDGHGMPIVDASNMASYGSEPSEPTSLDEPHITPTLPQSKVRATPVPSDGPTPPKNPRSPSMVVSSDPDSTMATKASSSETPGTEEIRRPFQFAMPRSFVGKLAEKDKYVSGQALKDNPARGRGRGRRKRRAEDGRTNIRSLPDFDEDPIEDTDGD